MIRIKLHDAVNLNHLFLYFLVTFIFYIKMENNQLEKSTTHTAETFDVEPTLDSS